LRQRRSGVLQFAGRGDTVSTLGDRRLEHVGELLHLDLAGGGCAAPLPAFASWRARSIAFTLKPSTGAPMPPISSPRPRPGARGRSRRRQLCMARVIARSARTLKIENTTEPMSRTRPQAMAGDLARALDLLRQLNPAHLGSLVATRSLADALSMSRAIGAGAPWRREALRLPI